MSRIRKPRTLPKPVLVIGGLLLLGIIVLAILELTDTTHLLHKAEVKPVGTTGNAYTKGVTQQSESQNQSGTSQSANGADDSSKHPVGTVDTNATLAAPWGTFANKYQGVGLGEQLSSTCNTTPGATCQLLFTKNGITKSLDVENTDSGGAVYWSWNPAGIGLTSGVWHITAKAVLGSQVKTTSNDPLTLEISQ
jgi:hypothetical protein